MYLGQTDSEAKMSNRLLSLF